VGYRGAQANDQYLCQKTKTAPYSLGGQVALVHTILKRCLLVFTAGWLSRTSEAILGSSSDKRE